MNTESEQDSLEIESCSISSSPPQVITAEEIKAEIVRDEIKKEFVEKSIGKLDSVGNSIRKKLTRTTSLTKDRDTNIQKVRKLAGRSGTRSDSGVVHVDLEKVFKTNSKRAISTSTSTSKIQITNEDDKKLDANVIHVEVVQTQLVNAQKKMDLEKAIAMIPICTGKKDFAEFINTCEIALKEVKEDDKLVLLKIITSKLTGNALEVTKYRELDSWGSIKTILEGAFEQKVSERALSSALTSARMTEGETVAKFAARIEELYYKLCEASTIGLTKAEATVVKNQARKQAMIIFMTGLPNHLYTVLKSRNPDSLEQCFKLAIDEDLEFSAKLDMEKMQGNVQKQNNNDRQAGSSNDEKRQNDNRNNMFNRNGNNHANQNNRNNNFNRFNNNNRNGYNNINRNAYIPNNNNRGNNWRGGNAYRQNFNNNFQRNNANQNNTGCYTCGRTNHFAKDCWLTVGRPSTQQNKYDNNRNGGARNTNNISPRREGNNAQSTHCSYCNRIGHEIANCFTKQKNERNSKNSKGQSQVGIRLVQEIIQDPQDEFSTSQQN